LPRSKLFCETTKRLSVHFYFLLTLDSCAGRPTGLLDIMVVGLSIIGGILTAFGPMFYLLIPRFCRRGAEEFPSPPPPLSAYRRRRVVPQISGVIFLSAPAGLEGRRLFFFFPVSLSTSFRSRSLSGPLFFFGVGRPIAGLYVLPFLFAVGCLLAFRRKNLDFAFILFLQHPPLPSYWRASVRGRRGFTIEDRRSPYSFSLLLLFLLWRHRTA